MNYKNQTKIHLVTQWFLIIIGIMLFLTTLHPSQVRGGTLNSYTCIKSFTGNYSSKARECSWTILMTFFNDGTAIARWGILTLSAPLNSELGNNMLVGHVWTTGWLWCGDRNLTGCKNNNANLTAFLSEQGKPVNSTQVDEALKDLESRMPATGVGYKECEEQVNKRVASAMVFSPSEYQKGPGEKHVVLNSSVMLEQLTGCAITVINVPGS